MERHKISAAFISFFFLFCATSAFAKTGPEPLAPLGYRAGPMPQGHGAGPIPIRNQMPLYLFFLQMEPDKANVTEQNKFDINAGYTVSNVTVSCFTPATSLYNINIDAEVSRMTLDLRYGLSEKLEAGLEVPYLSLSRGYLDRFVGGFEDTVGATTPRSRVRQGAYNYNYSFIYNTQELIGRKHSSEGLGDVVLKAKYQVLEEAEYSYMPNISFRSAVKFPTGRKKDLTGSGEFDYGLGVVADKSFFKRIRVYCGLNAVFIKKPSFFSVLDMKKEIFSGMLGMEYFFTNRFSMVAQVTGNSTPYPSSETNALDDPGIDAGLGVNYKFKEKENVSWHFAFTENINSAASPDVNFDTGFNVGF